MIFRFSQNENCYHTFEILTFTYSIVHCGRNYTQTKILVTYDDT